MEKLQPDLRGDYRHFTTVATRWMDNDVYGHINNVQYYSYFDTVINRYLIEHGGLDIHGGDVIGIAAESHCNFFSPAAFPEEIEAGLRVGHLGRSSVRYEVGLFVARLSPAIARGYFVHVFVERADNRPVEMPADLRAALAMLER